MKGKFTIKMKEKLEKEFKFNSSFSFILLGDSGVGKTNFMTRYMLIIVLVKYFYRQMDLTKK